MALLYAYSRRDLFYRVPLRANVWRDYGVPTIFAISGLIRKPLGGAYALQNILYGCRFLDAFEKHALAFVFELGLLFPCTDYSFALFERNEKSGFQAYNSDFYLCAALYFLGYRRVYISAR